MLDDVTLLRRYADEHSEEAFAELLRRYLPLVYSAALRRLGGDAHRAQDVAQVVFCKLARQSRRIAQYPVLTGWLYTATRNAVIDVVRAEQRRRLREGEAHMMQQTTLEAQPPADWSQLRPILDSAMDQLNERDREAVLLRFFHGQPFGEIGRAIGLSEEAARKRVERALDKLRDALRAQGTVSTSSALAVLLANQAIGAAPASLAASVTSVALATTGTVTGGLMGLLAMTKIQTGIVATLVMGGAIGMFTQQRTISELRAGQLSSQPPAANSPAQGATSHTTQVASGAPQPAARIEEGGRKAAVENTARAARASQSSASASLMAASAGRTHRRPSNADMHRRYDPFLDKYGLTPAQAERFIELKLAIYDTQDDLQAAMRQAGAQGGTRDIEAMRSKLVRPMWDEIRQVLGEEAYRAYGEFEKTSAIRGGYVEPLLPLFSSANVPLSTAQADELVRVFAANQQVRRVNPTDLGSSAFMDWDAVWRQANGILTPAQLRVFEAHVERRRSNSRTP